MILLIWQSNRKITHLECLMHSDIISCNLEKLRKNAKKLRSIRCQDIIVCVGHNGDNERKNTFTDRHFLKRICSFHDHLDMALKKMCFTLVVYCCLLGLCFICLKAGHTLQKCVGEILWYKFLHIKPTGLIL